MAKMVKNEPKAEIKQRNIVEESKIDTSGQKASPDFESMRFVKLSKHSFIKGGSKVTYTSVPIIVETANGRVEWQLTPVEKMEIAREGVSKKQLEVLKKRISLGYDELSAALATTRATLINKKGKEHFSQTLSERIVSIAELYSFGYEVFGEEAAFNKWIIQPNRALGGQRPYDLLNNQFGREEVKNLIGRIEHGIYA